MSENKRTTIFLIGGSILAIILGFLSLYFLFWRIGPQGEVRPIGEFLPFGRAPDVNVVLDQSRTDDDELDFDNMATSTDALDTEAVILFQITDEPIAGQTIVPLVQENGLYKMSVRYMERATGQTFEYMVGERRAPERLTNTTIPRVYEAIWTEQGQGVIARFLAVDNTTIRSFYGSLKDKVSTTSTSLLEGEFLPENLMQIAVSPKGDEIAFVEAGNAGAIIARSKPDGSSRKVLLDIPLKEWLVSWPNSDELALVAKPSAGVPGQAFTLSIGGRLRGLISRINGLTINADKAKMYALYGGNDILRGYILSLYNRATHASSALDVTTIPEKCVWSSANLSVVFCAVPVDNIGIGEPDRWYMGRTSFSDDIWKIDVKTGSTERVIALEREAREPIDAIDMQLSDDDSLLVFRNKRDSSLWGLIIKEE
jgi:hypothetical protein